MGCTQSTSSDHGLRFSRLEGSITEVLIAKRPGGHDVGPIRIERTSERSIPGESEIEEESVPETIKTKKLLPIGVLLFSVAKVVADEDGVMFYYFRGTSADDPTNEIRIAKRFSDFKVFHAQISNLMANERNVPPTQQHLFETHPALPEMPKANILTFLRGRYNDKVLKEREEQFARILNAISRHPVAFQSRQFTAFLQA
ncbi:hypothetical protein PHMEG_00016900 [Phytophthora megakarya]|uniref:PX domain-containing protein n=1 Tax=Phytophthora megakarya TaxID=4795 RepID=A0A225VXV0_9STRA|nr:hypothetical protein PHMEG_00016900 [Phytophthora megakarya]